MTDVYSRKEKLPLNLRESKKKKEMKYLLSLVSNMLLTRSYFLSKVFLHYKHEKQRRLTTVMGQAREKQNKKLKNLTKNIISY